MIFRKFFSNLSKPRSSWSGRFILHMMNHGHREMALWCIENAIYPGVSDDILDLGCGGGANIAHMLKRTQGNVFGLDYSSASVQKTLKMNQAAVSQGRTQIVEANVAAIPFDRERFDLVTAFETVYFWPNVEDAFGEALRVLRSGGRFAVCNEMDQPEGNERWIEMLRMTIYTPEQIVGYMDSVGFRDIQHFHRTDGATFCVIGSKP